MIRVDLNDQQHEEAALINFDVVGADITARAWSSIIDAAAISAAQRATVAAVRQSHNDVEAGLVPALDFTNADIRQAYLEQVYVRELAWLAITDWLGVGDLSGEPLPVSRAAVVALLAVPGATDAFLREYRAASVRLEQEKKASNAARAGTGAADPAIAEAAQAGAIPAPVSG